MLAFLLARLRKVLRLYQKTLSSEIQIPRKRDVLSLTLIQSEINWKRLI
jgi:hypothetical protein